MIRTLTDLSNPVPKELLDLVERAAGGDQTVMSQLRRYLDEVPQLWKEYGDLALQATLAWIQLAAGDNAASRECIWRQVTKLKSDVLQGSQAPLESLLS